MMTREYKRSDGKTRTVHYRDGTTDANALVEVVDRKGYRKSRMPNLPPAIYPGFDVQPHETWLDLGANIGSFAVYCWLHMATSIGFEPDPECYKLLVKNSSKANSHNLAVTTSAEPVLPFCKGSKESDHYRTTIFTTRTPHPKGELPNIHVSKLPKLLSLPKNHVWDGIKMDIEGSEFSIIDEGLVPPTKKLVFEYHFSRDKSMTNFHRRIKILRKQFRYVVYPPGLDREYPNDKFPGFFDRLVFAHTPR